MANENDMTAEETQQRQLEAAQGAPTELERILFAEMARDIRNEKWKNIFIFALIVLVGFSLFNTYLATKIIERAQHDQPVVPVVRIVLTPEKK